LVWISLIKIAKEDNMNPERELRKEYKKLVRMEDRYDMPCGVALQEHFIPELATQRNKVANLLAKCKEANKGGK